MRNKKYPIPVTLLAITALLIPTLGTSADPCWLTWEDYVCGWFSTNAPGTCATGCVPYLWYTGLSGYHYDGGGFFRGSRCLWDYNYEDDELNSCLDFQDPATVTQYGFEYDTEHCPDTCGIVEVVKQFNFNCGAIYPFWCDE
jgi:hypothetical protein